MKRIVSLIATVLVSVPLWTAIPADTARALEKGDMGTITPTSGPLVADEDPGGFTGVYPYQGVHAFSYFRPPTCREVTYCHTHVFSVEPPEGYLEIYGVTITLHYEGIQNKVSLHVWADQGCCFGGVTAGCATPPSCDNEDTFTGGEAGWGPPISVSLSEPSGELWITVANVEGVNTKYKLTVEWFVEELPPLPDFSPPSSGGSGGFGSGGFDGGGSGSDSGRTGGFTTDGGSEPDVETTTILVPGPDGELIEMELPVYTRAAGAQDEGGIPLLIPITVALLLLAASAGGFFFFRARRRGEEDELATPTGFHY
jgi:hypothetical protein